MSEPSEHLWRVWGLILNANSPLLPSCWGFSFALGCGVSPHSRGSSATQPPLPRAVKVLHSICQQIWKTQQWPWEWKRSVFIPIPKKGNAKECSNYQATALISHASKVMLKILQARLQQYMNRELQDVKLDIEKAEEPEIKLPTSVGSLKKQENSRKTSTFALLITTKPLTVYQNKLWKILKEMGIPDHLICLL